MTFVFFVLCFHCMFVFIEQIMRAGVTLCACGCLFMCASVTYVRRSLRGGCTSYVIPQTLPSERISQYDKWLF